MANNNFVLPFMIDESALSGRLIRLDSVLNDILSRHDYPDAVNALLGQFMVLGTSLANALKYDGIFTFEARGDGVVPLMVCDVTADGSVRGYAQIDGDIPNYDDVKDTLVSSLMGTGHMMFTVDQSATQERYQGIVELKGDTLEQSIAEYFDKSAQFISVFRIACEKLKNNWVAGCIAIQKLPAEETKHDTESELENWNRATVLLKSTKDNELTDINISAGDLLYRLYNEDGVRIYDTKPLLDKCRCSRERMLKAVLSVPENERSTLLTDNNTIDVKCEYCSTTHKFDKAESQIKNN